MLSGVAPLATVLGNEVAAVLAAIHREHGVRLVTNDQVIGFEGGARADGQGSFYLTQGTLQEAFELNRGGDPELAADAELRASGSDPRAHPTLGIRPGGRPGAALSPHLWWPSASFMLTPMIITCMHSTKRRSRHLSNNSYTVQLLDPGARASSVKNRGRQLMARTSFPSWDENTIEVSVTVHRPVEEVFRFYRDFQNLPRFLGDVMDIEQIGPATSRWTIQGPLGIRVNWTMKVTEVRTNALIRYQTVTLPLLRTSWEIQFAPGSQAGETEIREVMKVPLGRPGRAALALLGKFPAEEVAANLHRLKQIMETGRVTDTSYAVAGKFAQDTASHTALRPWADSVGKSGRGQKSKNSLLKQILWWLTSMFLPGRCTQQRQSSDGEASAQHLNRREWKQ